MEIAAELFRASGKPMTEAELHQLISSKRPIKFGSLASLLREDGRFRRVRPRTWELNRITAAKQ